MEPTFWHRIEELFNQALALPHDKRGVFLDEACGREAELRNEIESLIKEAEEQPGDFLSESAFTLGTQLLCHDQAKRLDGQTFGVYNIVSLLGRGGMGEVYLAEDPRLERLVALKLLPTLFREQGSNGLRIEQEARAASGVSHPNVAHVYEIGDAGGRHYIAMEYVRGDSLRELIGRGTLGVRESVEIALQVANALGAAHAAGVVHHDVKPENIIVRPDGYAKVLDFGLATLARVEEPTTSRARVGAASEGMPDLIAGTVAYMSPEQVSGRGTDARTDVWSLGVVLYEMLAKRRPFSGETLGDVAKTILTAAPEPLDVDDPRMSALASLVSKALAKDPDARYQTAADIARELTHIKDGLRVEEHTSAATRSYPRFSGELLKNLFSAERLFSFTHTQEATARPGGNVRWGAKIALTGLLVCAALLAGNYIRSLNGARGSSPAPEASGVAVRPARVINSLVILPFRNETGDAALEYVSTGLTEDSTRSLTRSRLLLVTAQYSARRASEMRLSSPQMWEMLGADAALQGAIRREGARLSIHLRLVELGAGAVLWEDSFATEQDDLLSISNSLTAVLITHIQGLVGEGKTLPPASRLTNNNEAYTAYLEGRYLTEKGGARNLRRSTVLFERAVALDPQFALAYVSLANSYNLLGTFLGQSPDYYQPRAKRAILRALALDDTLAEAHTSLAKIKMDYERDWTGAEHEFRRAIELNPGYSLAHHWYGEVYLSAMGRLDESLAELQRAHRLNPLSTGILTGIAWTHIGLRQYEQALDACRKAEVINPDDWTVYSYRMMAHMKMGRLNEAVGDALTAYKHEPTGSNLAALGAIYAYAGRSDEARRVLARLQEKPSLGDTSKYDLAIVHVALGEVDTAFKLLNEEALTNSVDLLSIRIDPMLDTLRGDERFPLLEARLGLASPTPDDSGGKRP